MKLAPVRALEFLSAENLKQLITEFYGTKVRDFLFLFSLNLLMTLK
jgi:hypothetical protein